MKNSEPEKSSEIYYDGAYEIRTPDLLRVRRTLIPAELCFLVKYYSTVVKKINKNIT